jgi:putative endonuclease
MHNKSLGKTGEDMAAEYLEDKGYDIIERNCRNKYGEIDLVCKKGDCLIFAEVKTRIGEQFGLPEDAINKEKINKLIKNAAAYVAFKAKDIYMYRIDAVCIVLDENMNPVRINHYENITL